MGTKVPQWGPVKPICTSIRGVVCTVFWKSFVWPVEIRLMTLPPLDLFNSDCTQNNNVKDYNSYRVQF